MQSQNWWDWIPSFNRKHSCSEVCYYHLYLLNIWFRYVHYQSRTGGSYSCWTCLKVRWVGFDTEAQKITKQHRQFLTKAEQQSMFAVPNNCTRRLRYFIFFISAFIVDYKNLKQKMASRETRPLIVNYKLVVFCQLDVWQRLFKGWAFRLINHYLMNTFV